MCYIHYFNTNVQQNKKEKNKPSCFSTHLSLQYNTYSSLAADILGLSALFHYQAHIGFRSGAHRFPFRYRRVVQQQYAYMLPYGPRTENALLRLKNAIDDDNCADCWQRPSSNIPELCAYGFPLPTDLMMKWKLTVSPHANTRPVFLLRGNRTSGVLLGQMSNWLLITCRNRGYCMFSVSISK